MTLTFLGTRGYIDVRTRRHARHAAMLVTHRGARVMLDCGEDWRGRLAALRPDAIVVTHAHPDHAGGLRDGAPCPVWATATTWRLLGPAAVAPAARRVIRLRVPTPVAGLGFEAFPVEHSLRAPAVGYRIAAGGVIVFYVPDVAAIPRARTALRGIDLYVGDGASLVRPILRSRGGARIGHAAIATQAAWCGAHGVPRAVFTHCGTGIVAAGARDVAARVAAIGRVHGVSATIAHDGMVVALRARGRSASVPGRRDRATPVRSTSRYRTSVVRSSESS